jgi:hypothetical protein
MNLREAALYWIRLPEHNDVLNQGYVGVSKNFDGRLKEHYRDIITKKHTNRHLMYAVEKYGWENLVKEPLLFGLESFCYQLERELRPHKGVGWNISPGGHRGPGRNIGPPRKKDLKDSVCQICGFEAHDRCQLCYVDGKTICQNCNALRLKQKKHQGITVDATINIGDIRL